MARNATPLISASWLFALTFLGVNLGQPLGVGQLPIAFLLKDNFGLDAAQVAVFSAVITIPFYLKPLAGILADTWLANTTHRLQLAASSLGVIVLWAVSATVTRSFPALAGSLFAMVLFVVFANTVLGGLLVEVAQGQGATGRLSAVRAIAEAMGIVLSGLLGGYLAGKPLVDTAAVGSACFLAVAVLGSRIKTSRDRSRNVPDFRSQLTILLQARELWMVVLVAFLILAAPGLQTTLLYFQTDTLHFSKQLIGDLTALNGFTALLGAGAYAYLCRFVPVRRLLWSGVAIYLVATLLYLGYRSETSAVIIQALNGVALAAAGLPALDLATRSCPKGIEAAAFGVILSVADVSQSFSNVSGSLLYTRYGFSFYELVWVNLAVSLLALPVLLRLPRSLTDQRDS